MTTPEKQMLRHLVAQAVRFAGDCELTGLTGEGRCIEPAVAVRWDGAFTDAVCEAHAERADYRSTVIFA